MRGSNPLVLRDEILLLCNCCPVDLMIQIASSVCANTGKPRIMEWAEGGRVGSTSDALIIFTKAESNWLCAVNKHCKYVIAGYYFDVRSGITVRINFSNLIRHGEEVVAGD